MVVVNDRGDTTASSTIRTVVRETRVVANSHQIPIWLLSALPINTKCLVSATFPSGGWNPLSLTTLYSKQPSQPDSRDACVAGTAWIDILSVPEESN